MRICYVGNFTQTHCTEVHLSKTLQDLGHTVVELQENGYTSDKLGNVLAQSDFDLFLFTRTWGETVTLEHLAQLRERKIPTVSYHLDLYVGLTRKYLHGNETLESILQNDPFWRTDFVFTPDGDPKSAEVFKANGVKHYYMKAGVFKPECYIADAEVPIAEIFGDKLDVLFVGGGDTPGSPHAYGHPEWNYRNELIQWLRNTYGDQFIKKGHPQETVRNDALNKLYAMFKVTVGDSVCLSGFTHENYWSDRVYETIGRGGFLIHPRIKGLEDEFTDGETIVFYDYGNWAQLKEKIDYYLEHDDEREKIRRAGHEFVKNNCTYHDRLKQMLDTVSDTSAVPTPSDVSPTVANSAIKINLGAGSEPTEGWINVDWIKGEGIQVVHNLLEFPWPFVLNSADEIKAIDVLEHMPLFNAKNESTPMKFIEECHNILKQGGKLTIQVPHYESPNLWIDPTHVRGYAVESFDYFDPEKPLGKAYGYYSDKKFKVEASLSIMENQTKAENNGKPSNVTFVMEKL